MWRKIKWGLGLLVVTLVAAFLHYTLPQRDVVRITNTYNRLTTVGTENSWAYASPDSGTAESVQTRDIRFIEAIRPNNRVIVYRNEDTGWVWPPYFKYDSSNLQAEASNARSTSAAPEWVVVTHYGWRVPLISIYPNAVKVTPVSGPDVSLIPWLNMVILLALGLFLVMLWRMLAQFHERTIDPALDRIGDTIDEVDARADGLWARFSGWLNSWKGKPRR